MRYPLIILSLFSIILSSDYKKSTFLFSPINNKPFENSKLSIQITKDVPDKKLSYYYNSKNGINTNLELPFYIGDIRANLDLNFYEFSGNYPKKINFISIHPSIEWGKKIKLNKNLEWFNGLSLGFFIFYFEHTWKRFFMFASAGESEMSLGLSSILNYKINNIYSINFGIKKNTIFTYNKINIISFSIGLSKSFETPLWLIKILK